MRTLAVLLMRTLDVHADPCRAAYRLSASSGEGDSRMPCCRGCRRLPLWASRTGPSVRLSAAHRDCHSGRRALEPLHSPYIFLHPRACPPQASTGSSALPLRLMHESSVPPSQNSRTGRPHHTRIAQARRLSRERCSTIPAPALQCPAVCRASL